jgi:hypothetical protein
MFKKILVIMTIFAIGWPVCAFARMREDVSVKLKGPRGGGVYIAAAQQNESMAKGEIQKLQDTDLAQNTEQIVSYNEDGTISSVKYSDGTSVSYSEYQRNTDGNIENFKVSTDNKTILFSSGKGAANTNIELLGKGGADDELVVQVSLPDDGHGLNGIATKPLPKELLDSINKALDDLAKSRKSANDEYLNKTEQYYVEIEYKINEKKDRLTSDGAYMYKLLKEADTAPSQAAKRKAIDEAVGYLYAKARSGEKNEATDDFLAVEKGLRDEIIVPEMQVYEEKIESALKYVYSIIDELMKSKLALFMDANEDKINAIINLPKKK